MIHPISRVAESNFIKFADLLGFVRSAKCPQGVFEKETDDPITNTWYADDLVAAFYANGGQRMTDEEIRTRYGANARSFTLWNGKYAVCYRNGYRIVVDDVDDARYVSLWTDGNKRVGELSTCMLPVGGEFSGYLGISHVEIERSHRRQGLGLELYRQLLRYMGTQFKGIASYLPDQADKKGVSKIWAKLGGRTPQGREDYVVVDR